jgi:hypothetical protein
MYGDGLPADAARRPQREVVFDVFLNLLEREGPALAGEGLRIKYLITFTELRTCVARKRAIDAVCI